MNQSEDAWDFIDMDIDDVAALGEDEVDIDCPYCGETISLFLDLSIRRQTLIEDCEVCCRPIVLSYTVRDGLADDLIVRTEDDI